jgi:hypothetical protein
MKRASIILGSLSALLAGLALAQASPVVYVPTGTLRATIDGEPIVFATHANLVPDTDTAAIEDADARALAAALTGREVNTAGFRTTAPMVVGGVTALPATLFVQLRARVEPDSRTERRELVLSFALDPDTLAWDGDPSRVSVEFHPERWRATAHYQVFELHTFELTLAEAVEAHVLRVAGRLAATLAWREGSFQARVDPSRSAVLVVEFEAFPVVGDDVLGPLLERAVGGG